MNSHLHAVPHQTSLDCRSCGAPVSGNYCAHCAEPTAAHVPSAAEFAHEFVGHFIALEGKLWTTLRLLITRPGQLTAEFLRGRRVPYIPPLRLYLTLSLVFFALVKSLGVELPHINFDDYMISASYAKSVPGKKAHELDTITLEVKARFVDDHAAAAAPTGEVRDDIELLGKVLPSWAANLKKFMAMPAEKKSEILNHGFLGYLPYMLIGTLPLFACYLQLIYRGGGRHYGEHLVFALHANSAAFLVSSVMLVVPGSALWLLACLHQHLLELISPWDCVQLAPALYLLASLPLAMRRVYGGGRAATGVRWLVLLAAHLSVIALATLLAEMIAIVAVG